MIGAIIGDIIGSRFEFNNVLTYDQWGLFGNGCSYTDDTVCTLAIADAIVRGRRYDESLLEWCRLYPIVQGGYGGRFQSWIHSESPYPYNSFGNGSAMRVSPVAWAYNNLADVKEEAEKTASCTHNHPEGIKGAVAVAHAIWFFRFSRRLREFIDTMQEYYPGFESGQYPVGRFDESCQGTVPLCLQVIVRATNFEDAIRLAISHGGDSDTIGAIVGSIAEARFGIPPEILNECTRYLDKRMLGTILKFQFTYQNKGRL